MPRLIYLTNGTDPRSRRGPTRTVSQLTAHGTLLCSTLGLGWAVRVSEGPWAGSWLGWFQAEQRARTAWGFVAGLPVEYTRGPAP